LLHQFPVWYNKKIDILKGDSIMENPIFSFVVIPILILIVYSIVTNIRSKLAKPHYKKEIQTPGRFDNFIIKLLTFLTILCAIFTVLGVTLRENEMSIVFLVLTVIFWG